MLMNEDDELEMAHHLISKRATQKLEAKVFYILNKEMDILNPVETISFQTFNMKLKVKHII